MLCKPANLILLISIAGTLYHLLTGEYKIVLWWLIVGIVGVATFQGLCMGNFENIAWVLMLIPVLVVCFFMAVALLASSMRIKNVYTGPCNECKEKPKCNGPKPKPNQCKCLGQNLEKS